jgi:pyruvate/2-oxoglutarate dehydrogenase complex dihydrolipoamide acyltransferase (E2) component
MEQPSPPPPAAASPKVIATTKQPFAAAPSTDSPEADPEPEEDAEGDADTFNTEQALSKHVAREGVISGRVYRKSVVVSAKPKAPDAPAEKEGYLMKKSPAMLVGWQKRFFLTNSNGDIEYYKSVS